MEDLLQLFTSAGLVSLLTLTLLEIVLGVDNVIFISIVSNKLPKENQTKARSLGLTLALVARVSLLFGITWVIGLKDALFNLPFLEFLYSPDPHIPEFINLQHKEHIIQEITGISGKDLILFAGGLFLMAKSIAEMHDKFEEAEDGGPKVKKMGLFAAIIQIMLIDIVFSFDSILTAVGLVRNVYIMVAAVIVAMGIMLIFSGLIAKFVDDNPNIKMLALAFLVLIGFLLVAEAFGQHVPKGYVYFSMTFALAIELINMRLRKKTIKQSLLYDNEEDLAEEEKVTS